MPWCGPCQRYFTPAALKTGGACPVCGEATEQADLAPGAGERAEVSEAEARAPWHFWLVVVATVVYVGWRIVQLVLSAL
ncbi:MAG: hypothetical protein OXI26_05620 [bacterium]|nr:hypothetical protein [bacterium]